MNRPLAEQLRPQSIDGFIGQDHLRGKITALLESPRLPSLLLFGPPGCGKSSLALLLAHAKSGKVLRLSAPEAGLAQIRKLLGDTEILVLDELHRFSKAQQDFFLPLLESGELTMIATTTENPSFCVTRQMLSRLHVFRLSPLSRSELAVLAERAFALGGMEADDETAMFLATIASGDARINLVEYAAALPKEKRSAEALRELLPASAVRHDRNGDSHYELASALIKSIRGSDPDAALYYLGCLIEGGEDPRFMCRRLILSAAEDIGLGDPNALSVAVACQQAVEFVGMPEGSIPLAETVVYLATAPKNNATYSALHNVTAEIRKNGVKSVPLHLRNASSRLQKEWGYGSGYLYPHDFPQGWVKQDYLPDGMAGKRFYHPKNIGAEASLTAWWRKKTGNSSR